LGERIIIMKKAFTLIELLVVIAIIAILAAILFPVFAQAKTAAQKTSSLSNAKQMGTAFHLYLSDNDDSLPFQSPIDPGGVYVSDFSHAIPAGWDYAANEAADAQGWGNSIQPYVKNFQMMAAPSMPKYRYTAADKTIIPPYATPRRNWFNSSYTFNGLMNTMNMSQVEMPSRIVLLWQGEGKVAGEGYANSSPLLKCESPNPEPCRFNPSGPPQTSGGLNSNGTGDYWWNGPNASPGVSFATYGPGMIYVASDTSAKFRRNGADGRDSSGSNPRIQSFDDPFSAYNAQGAPQGMWACTTSGVAAYRSFFRPDETDGRWQFGAALTARCDQ
jgi:prepilin-type N-terminal cleavage/methylation domain-containing protein